MRIDNMLSEEDSPLWNGYLYQLQEEAPRPKPVLTDRPEAAIGRPHYFGAECHGLISREEGDALCSEEGNFLIRESQNERGRYTLVLRILGTVKNFKLYWEDGQFFVGDKRFDNIKALVEDGLITMYVEEKAHDYIQNMSKDRSVYSSLSKTRRLLTGPFPDNRQSRPSQGEHRGSPRRSVSVRVQGNSPRYAHNGINTENAALPYTYYQGREYYDPSCHSQNTAALEDRLIATRLQQAPSNGSYYHNASQTGHSMMEGLLNARTEQYANLTLSNGPSYADATMSNGGAKKSLTPTSSDERKRPKAKKVATERAVAQHQYDTCQNETQYAQETPMYSRNHYDLEESYGGGRPQASGEGHYYQNRLKVPAQLKNRPFHQSAPSNNSPRHSPQRSPMLRNNSDPNQALQASYQYSMMAQLAQSNVAHVRQLSSGHSSNAAVGTNAHMSSTDTPSGSAVEKIILDANDNQMVVSTAGHPRYYSPNRSRQSPRQPGFDSSGNEVIPANTFHQLKMFHKRLEEDENTHKEAQDAVSTLRGHAKTPVRLTRSHTTAGIAVSAVRPHSGGKVPSKQPPGDAHFRQRSEPVELFLPRKASSTNLGQHQVLALDRQSSALRHKDFYMIGDQGDLRAGSSGSCDSSLSNLSSVGSSAMPHVSEAYIRPPDSISHLSSEDWTGEERESSPSPHSTSQRSCSSDDNSLPKSRDSRSHLGRQNAVIFPDHPESRDVITALQRVSPKLKVEQKSISNSVNLCRSVCVPPPEALSGSRPRRKNSDSQIPSKTKHDGTNSKIRHHSETSSEDGTIKQPYPAHKPLQRRATTGSSAANKNEHLPDGNPSVLQFSSPKKVAHRSNSGPSPRKGKKSPDSTMSPRLQHIHHQRSLSSPRNDVHYYDKDHVFKSHTYRGLQWCEYCGNFMWGIIQQGMQCRDCGLNVHKQCSKLVPGDCQPALKHVKTVFGIDLTALVKLHGTERPVVVDKCIAEIEQRGMQSEGIYRVSGFHDDVQQLKLAFDRYGNEVDLSLYEDINIVAGGLKLYLRELPVPLIPYNLYSRFINAAKLSYGDGKLDAIRRALEVMPPAHLQTLKHVVQHLGRVCDREENQMDSLNLGIVFGPTMLRQPEKSVPSRYNLNDAQYQKEIVQAIIDNRCKLFGPKKDLTIRETHNL